MKNTKDNFMARIHLIQYFLQEPAYAEIMLVRLQHLHDVYIRVVRSPSSVVLHYHGTSLSMLLQKLERPDSASDEATISIIVANLTLNQQFEDWNSFSAYIYGLIRVVGLHGGLGALRKRDPRTLTLVRELYAMYQHLTKSATLLSGKVCGLFSMLQLPVSPPLPDFRAKEFRQHRWRTVQDAEYHLLTMLLFH